MAFSKYIPAPELQSFIKCYYITEHKYDEYVSDVFFADGCIEIVFHIGVDFYRGEEKENWATIIGQITQPLHIKAIGHGRSFGIWFLPHTFSMFCDIPLNKLNDKAIDVETLLGNDIIEFVGNCLYTNKIDNLLKGINSYLIKIVEKKSNLLKSNLSAYAVQYILKHKENLSIDKLVKECNVSNRYLQKFFLQKIGVSPKFFMRIMRFQNALYLLNNHHNTSLTSLAYDANYYDQAHFIKEFKVFTGFIPSLYKSVNQPINNYFLNL